MNEHDLFTAIGNVEAHFLEELEAPPIHRLPRHLGLVAALLALLLAACAAPAIVRNFQALQVGTVMASDQDMVLERILKDGQEHILSVETDRISNSHTVSLEVTASPDAPQTIETRYLPLALLDHCTLEEDTDTESVFSLALSMNLPKAGRCGGILYQQHVLPEDGHIEVEGILGTGLWETESKTYADISVLEISGKAPYAGSLGATLAYTKHLFWSDGLYLYCLKIPMVYPLNVEKIDDILTSLTAVENPSEYLITPEP